MNTRTDEQNRTHEQTNRTDEQKTGGANMNRRTEQTNRTDEHNNNNNNNMIGGNNMIIRRIEKRTINGLRVEHTIIGKHYIYGDTVILDKHITREQIVSMQEEKTFYDNMLLWIFDIRNELIAGDNNIKAQKEASAKKQEQKQEKKKCDVAIKRDVRAMWQEYIEYSQKGFNDKLPQKRDTDFNAMANNINMLLSNGDVQDIAIYDFALFCVFSVFKFLCDQNRNNVKNTEKSNDKITLDNIPYGIVSYDFARKACVIKSKSILDYKIMGDTIDDNFDYVHDAYITILQEAKKQKETFGDVRLFRRYVVKRTYRHMSEHHKLITKYVDTTIYKEAMRTVRNNIEKLKRRIEQTEYNYFDVTSRYENMQEDIRIYRRTKSLQYMPYGEFNSLHDLMIEKGELKDEYKIMYAFIYDMKLSPIELKTLKYILQGDSRQVVAEKLNVSKGTINSYMQRIKEKALKCNSIIEYMPTLLKVKEDIEQKKHEQKEKDEQKKLAKKLEKEKEFKH